MKVGRLIGFLGIVLLIGMGAHDDDKPAGSKPTGGAVKAAETTKPAEPQAPGCKTDWKLCGDNSDMANNWSGWYKVTSRCKRAAEEAAKYGDPEWPWFTGFSYFKPGTDFVQTGIVIAIDNEARYPNAFNAKVKARTVCKFDLNTEKVLDLTINAK